MPWTRDESFRYPIASTLLYSGFVTAVSRDVCVLRPCAGRSRFLEGRAKDDPMRGMRECTYYVFKWRLVQEACVSECFSTRWTAFVNAIPCAHRRSCVFRPRAYIPLVRDIPPSAYCEESERTQLHPDRRGYCCRRSQSTERHSRNSASHYHCCYPARDL